MPKIEVINTDDEHDIWDYKSQVRLLSKGQDAKQRKRTSTQIKPDPDLKDAKQRRTSTQIKPDPDLRVKTEKTCEPKLKKRNLSKKQKSNKNLSQKTTVVKQEVTPARNRCTQDRSGCCPICQMPFELLCHIETPSWHIDACLEETPCSTKQECSKGEECDSVVASHYKKFRHTQLARSRRKNQQLLSEQNKGDVDGAKTRLNFDGTSENKTLSIPGNAPDCVINLADSSADEVSCSQRSDDNVLDAVIINSDSHESENDFGILGDDNDNCGALGEIVDEKIDIDDGHINSSSKVNGDTKLVSGTDHNTWLLSSESSESEPDDDDDEYTEITVINSDHDEIDGGNVTDFTNNALNGINIEHKSVHSLFHSASDEEKLQVENNESKGNLKFDQIPKTFRRNKSTKSVTIENNTNTCKKTAVCATSVGSEFEKNVDDDNDLDCNVPKETEIKTLSGVTSTNKVVESSEASTCRKFTFKRRTASQIQKDNNRKECTDLTQAKKSETVDEEVNSEEVISKVENINCGSPTSSVENIDDILEDSDLSVTISQMLESEEELDTLLKSTDTESSDKKKDDKRRVPADEKQTTDNDSNVSARKVPSAIPSLSEGDTDGSDDWEILKTTLTQPSFSQISNKGSKQTSIDTSNKTDTDVSSKSCNKKEMKGKVDEQEGLSNDNMENTAFEVDLGKELGKENADQKMTDKIGDAETERPGIMTDKTGDAENVFAEIICKGIDKADNDSTDSGIGFFAKKRLEKESSVTNVKTVDSTRRTETVSGLLSMDERSNSCDMYSTIKARSRKSVSEEKNLQSDKESESVDKSIEQIRERTPDTAKEDPVITSKKKPILLGKRTRTPKKSKKTDKSQKLSKKPSSQRSMKSFFHQVKKEEITICTDESSGNITDFNDKRKCCLNCALESSKCAEHSVMKNVKFDFHGLNCNDDQNDSDKNSVDNVENVKDFSSIKCSTSMNDGTQEKTSNVRTAVSCIKTSTPIHKLNVVTTHSSQNSAPMCNNSESMHSIGSTPHFDIQDICTLSQNTYANMGGFIPEEDSDPEPLRHPSVAQNTDSQSMELSKAIEEIAAIAPKDVLGFVTKKVCQIQKNAAEILMASSKFLYGNINGRKVSPKSATATTGSQQSVNDVLMRSESQGGRTSGPSQGDSGRGKGRGWGKRRWGGRGQNSEDLSTDDSTNNNGSRKCPFYKKIPGTSFTVDAFCYGLIPDCKAYILSHFHYDHYGGLKKNFTGHIYCSKITGNLVRKKIGVASQYIHTVPLNTPTEIENVEVTLLEANHCPGAVLILFKLKTGKVHLHTGDFRASQNMESYPALQNLKIHSLYLDTTYCDPQYDFPPQDEVISFAVKLATDTLSSSPKTLIACGSYTIGKERIFTAIAEALDLKICVTSDKKSILDCLEDEQLKQRVQVGFTHAGLHVVPMNKLNLKGLQEHLSQYGGGRYDQILAIEPTGWSHSKNKTSLIHTRPKIHKDNVKLYGLPYSEHSSYLEMKKFVQYTRPEKILPTVNNGNVHSRRKMKVIFEAWLEENR